MVQKSSEKIKISFREALGLLAPYVKDRIAAQIKSVWVIIVYLIVFQTLILGIAISDASLVAGGIALVIIAVLFLSMIYLFILRRKDPHHEEDWEE